VNDMRMFDDLVPLQRDPEEEPQPRNGLKAERRARHSGALVINRKLSPVIRHCVERGLAKIRRKRLGKNATLTMLDTGLHDCG